MRLISAVLALALTTSSALAGDSGVLSAGAPAGVKQAQMEGNSGLYVLLGVGVIAAIALASSNSSDNTPAPTPAPPATTT